MFRWVLFTPQIDKCLPFTVGVQGPQDELDRVDMDPRWDDRDDFLQSYGNSFEGTPVFQHGLFALLSAIATFILLRRRRTADTDAYTFSYDQAADLLAQREVFDATKEPAADQERYGTSEFGKHCLLARRLLERGVPFVQINHSNYDTHFENFDFHIEQLGEFDQPFAMLVADLADRGLLADTLICVMSEFGRTPKINARYGRDRVRFACSGTDRPWKLKAEFLSQRYTTRWTEILCV